MIAKVRIAPIERWCGPDVGPYHQTDIQVSRAGACPRIVGQVISIKTETMRTDEVCNGRAWFMTEESARRLDALLGRDTQDWSDTQALICEHMLEMD